MTNKTDKNSNAIQAAAQSQSEQLPTDTNPQAQNTSQPATELFEPVIFVYSRKDAIADGVQVDVSTTAAELGFKMPVFLTHTVFEDYVRVPENVTGQDESGRLWDVLWMSYCAIGNTRRYARKLTFQLYVHNSGSEARNTRCRNWGDGLR